MANGFNLLASFSQGRQMREQQDQAQQRAQLNALALQGQQQKLQQAQATGQRQQTQFDQGQQIQRSRIMAGIAERLQKVPEQSRRQMLMGAADQLENFGFSREDLINAPVDDATLRQVQAVSQSIIADPSKLTQLTGAEREREALMSDLSTALDDQGNIDPSKLTAASKAAAIKLRLLPGAVGSGAITTATIPGLTKDVAESKGDIAGEVAKQTVVGKAAGESVVSLPQTLATANDSLSVIDDVLNHPGLEGATGLASVVNPANFVPGTPEHDFSLAAEQIQGQAFLQAFQSLKGGGQITQIEGDKATAAIAQLSRKQSTPQYRKALRTLRDIVVRAKDRAVDAADKGASSQPDFDPALLEFMTPEEKALFDGS